MSDIKVSSRYAQALMDLSLQKDQLENVLNDIKSILKTIAQSPDLERMLQSPIISKPKKQAVLQAVFGPVVNSSLSMDFLEMVLKKSRESALVSIANSFIDLYNKKAGLQPAKVISATALDSDLLAKIIHLIEKISGAKALLTQQIDPALIGGYIIQIEDTQIDASVRSKLNNLKNQLN